MSKRPIIASLKELVEAPSYDFGTIIDLDYSKATFATQDYRVAEAGGIPQRCFLLAVPEVREDEEIREIILLSVKNRIKLQQDSGFQGVKESLAISGEKIDDPRTRQALTNLAFACEIVGTFYDTEEGIRFGGDIDRIRGNSVFKVYKPKGKALSYIASFSNNRIEPDAVLDLGVVRFSETQMDPDPAARVFINIKDFIGKKSAVFGITRSGKSNTIKILCQKTFEYAKNTNKNIGQLIFDPQGEYANTNVQDGEALANIGSDDEVRIYKILRDDEVETEKIRHLQFNILDEENVSFLWKLILKNLNSGVSSGTNYIANIENLKFYRPGRNATEEQIELWNRQKLGVYGLVGTALTLNSNTGAIKVRFPVTVGSRAHDIAEIHDTLKVHRDDQIMIENIDDARLLLEYLVDMERELNSELRKELDRGILTPFKEQLLAVREGRNGVMAAIRRVEQFHNSRATGDVRKNIWRDMKAGRLVMVDLSKGSSKTSANLSEVIVESLVSSASDRFTKGESMIPFQIVVEEAHNLFGRATSDDDAIDPWVRLSKEASKYEIGLVYATQEITSVDTKILSNTSNWLVAHLNSKIETKELSSYYLFSEWGEHIRKVETKGFARMKNESSPYIIPVQIDRFVVETPASKVSESKNPKTEVMPDVDDLEDLF